MNIVELELDETLADFEIQDWIDNVFSVQFPEIKAKIKHGCSGICNKDKWHYVNNELPIGKPYQNGTKAFVTVAYINNYNVPRKLDCYYWNNEFLCDSTYGYKKVEDVYGKVYAWKYEDKLPELKEIEK